MHGKGRVDGERRKDQRQQREPQPASRLENQIVHHRESPFGGSIGRVHQAPWPPARPGTLTWINEKCCSASMGRFVPGRVRRSEEHTSELQSLMRNSYAVFCLNKQTDTNQP